MSEHLKIERLGGLAGMGSARSKLRSIGEADLDALSTEDRNQVEQLFAQGGVKPSRLSPHMFRYRLTRITANGRQTIEAPEDDVPPAVVAQVHDGMRPPV
ncbi:protealysin inhibitor emfourin [Sphingomonas sp.]|uniref:protealysin inhibitor emfourin n=1 Tax=Sphingomonas sp. TaxID=28214 RepID=UPI0035A974CA